MAGDCKTAAALLKVIAGKDPMDNYTSAIPFNTIPDYAASCSSGSFNGTRIGELDEPVSIAFLILPITGVPSNFVMSAAYNQPEIEAYNASFSIMESLGATVVQNANFPTAAVANDSSIPGWADYGQSQIVLGADFLVGFERYTSELLENPENVYTVQDLLNFTIGTPVEDYPDRNVAVWQYALGLNLTQDSPEYTAALDEDLYLGGQGTLLGAMDKYNLDALILPSNQAWALPAIAGKSPSCIRVGTSNRSHIDMTGYPAISVPLGYYPANTTVEYNSRHTLAEAYPHMPFGLTFIGRRFSEETLIALACAFESATQVRAKVQPYFVSQTSSVIRC